MNAGRELDALIAEKVFGLKVVRSERGGWSIGPQRWHDIQGDMQLANPLAFYSADIASAWEVKIQLTAWAAVSEFKLVQDYEGLWACYISWTNEGEPRKGETLNSSDAPLAICLAALKAVTS